MYFETDQPLKRDITDMTMTSPRKCSIQGSVWRHFYSGALTPLLKVKPSAKTDGKPSTAIAISDIMCCEDVSGDSY